MAPRPRVKCACGCGDKVTTEVEAQHLQQKYYARSMPVPLILRQRRSLRSLSPPEPGPPLRPTPERLALSPSPESRPASPEHLDIGGIPDSEDPALLWARVLAERVRIEEEEDSRGSQISVTTGFVSQSDSDASAEPIDPPEDQFNPATYGISPGELLREERRVRVVLEASKNLTSSQLDDIEIFDFIVRDKISVKTYHRMQQRFCLARSHASLPSLKNLRSRILALSGLKPVVYDCCKNSCVCFAGPFVDLQKCPTCDTPRKNAAGAAQKTFSYIPLIPQLKALYCSLRMCEAMRYRHNYKRNDDTIEDFFDANRYCELLDTYVTVDGEQKPFKFFADWREIALALSTDGMCPFKRRKNSCWPLILVNLNLPPDQRTHLENLICVGVVPGPKSPKNLGSFLWPLVDELLELASGVTAVNASTQKLFSLRAHLLAVFGDIPAITKLLEFVGHNGRYPCRFCLMSAIQGATAGGGTHLYCPLHRKEAPFYYPLHLPLRNHQECIDRGLEVLKAPSKNAQSNLATASGVKGVSALARLPSISIPASFPIDIMHMIFINLIPQLVDIWTGTFNNMGEGKENYSIDLALFKELGEIIFGSGSTMPTSYGCRCPNISLPSHGNATAEAWSIFGGYLGPCVLRRRFRESKYYRHFVRLIKLVNRITSFKIKRSDIQEIREGFITWVQDYEKYYYQHNPARMQTCTVNIHYLLHVADCIEYLGPAWGYWSYPMERFCSFVGGVVKSRRFPFENISRRIRDTAQLQIIRHLYGLHDQLSFLQPDAVDDEEAEIIPGYEHTLLLGRCAREFEIEDQLRRKICGYLVQSFGISTSEAKKAIPKRVTEWRRLRISQGGDTMTARGCQKIRPDARDSSFVRYELLVDANARHRNAPVNLQPASQYGQLQHVFQLTLKARSAANPSSKDVPLVLALIREAPVFIETTYEYKVISYPDGELKSGEVVDARTIQCVLGRVLDRGRYWIIDRSADCEFTFPSFN